MVHCCCVIDCSSRSNRETHLSFFSLPLKNKRLLKHWIHVIRRKNLPLNRHTRICSRHFVNTKKRHLYPNEVPSLFLPDASFCLSRNQRKPPRDQSAVLHDDLEAVSTELGTAKDDLDSDGDSKVTRDVSAQTDMKEVEEVTILRQKFVDLERKLEETKFRLSNIKNDENMVTFYTGFPSYSTLKSVNDFLGPSVNNLKYSKKQEESSKWSRKKRLRQRSLPPLEEFLMTLVRLRLGLFEQDLAHRFGVSQSTVSRITCTWINFLYLKLEELPLWPPKELVKSNLPKPFRSNYLSTRVILDATEIYIEQPHPPELQQMTFSNYKNGNTYKALIGISPDGVITFVSSLFPGSISDKALTRQIGMLDLLEEGDSVMADRGFDIEEDLLLRGVHLNMPPFLRNKSQLSEKELIVTRRIASLRIHVERAMERIKIFTFLIEVYPSH